MYDGPQSGGLALLHIAAQQPLIAACVGIAVGTYIMVTPRTDLPVNLPSEVEATRLYDGVTGQYLTLADLAQEHLDPNTYDSMKGAPTKRCYVVENTNGQCVCEEIKPSK